jgi:molybdate transport system substrate-binding protein
VNRLAGVLAIALLAGCGSSGGGATVAAGGKHPQNKVVVFAASSLTKALTAEGAAYDAEHPGTTTTFSFAGSQALVAQLAQGAPADVLATADEASMKVAGLSGARVFARNRLAIITAPGNPKHLRGLADLARPGLRVVLAGRTVPVGKAAARALAAAGVTVKPVSLEQDVKGVVSKVRLGEADAGIAYVTDVGAEVAGIALPGISNHYPVAVVRPSPAAQGFVDFLLSPRGQSILASFGFLPPA